MLILLGFVSRKFRVLVHVSWELGAKNVQFHTDLGFLSAIGHCLPRPQIASGLQGVLPYKAVGMR